MGPEERVPSLLLLLVVVGAVVFLVLYTLKTNEVALSEARAKVLLPPSLGPASQPRRTTTTVSRLLTNPFATLIDRVYFINMDHREDRLHEIQAELARMEVPTSQIQRVPGVQDRFGALGCCKAHLHALLDAERQGYRHVIILEDDFVFKQSRKTTWDQLHRLFALQVVWDLVMLARNVFEWTPTGVDFLARITDAQTTSGYMVHRRFLPLFIANVQKGLALLEASSPPNVFTVGYIDQYWKSLQPVHHWFGFHPMLGHQRDGLSDIENRVTEYPDKTELDASRWSSYEYVVCLETTADQVEQHPGRWEALQQWSATHPVVCYRYHGDPALTEDFALNERDHILTLRCSDDVTHRCHKFGQLLGALTTLWQHNRTWRLVKGFFFTDLATPIAVETAYDGFRTCNGSAYAGEVQQTDPTDYRHVYPGLAPYGLQVPPVTYCDDRGFFLQLEAVRALSEAPEWFQPFPATPEALQAYQRTLPNGQVVYVSGSGLCVRREINVALALAQQGFAPPVALTLEPRWLLPR